MVPAKLGDQVQERLPQFPSHLIKSRANLNLIGQRADGLLPLKQAKIILAKKYQFDRFPPDSQATYQCPGVGR
jgi:hypothetical protein